MAVSRPGAGGPGPTATLLSISRNGFLRWSALPGAPRAAQEPHPHILWPGSPRPRPPGLKAGALSIRAPSVPTPQLTPLLTDLETKAKGRLVNNGIKLGVPGPAGRSLLAAGPRPAPPSFSWPSQKSLLCQGTELSSSAVSGERALRGTQAALSGGCSGRWPLASGHAQPCHFTLLF